MRPTEKVGDSLGERAGALGEPLAKAFPDRFYLLMFSVVSLSLVDLGDGLGKLGLGQRTML